MIWCVSDVSAMCHRSTPYDSYQIILPCTISTNVLSRIAFSTDTIVSAEYSHIHCFSPINFYPLIGYNRIINHYINVP